MCRGTHFENPCFIVILYIASFREVCCWCTALHFCVTNHFNLWPVLVGQLKKRRRRRPLVGSRGEHGTIIGMCWFRMAQDEVSCQGLWTWWEHDVPQKAEKFCTGSEIRTFSGSTLLHSYHHHHHHHHHHHPLLLSLLQSSFAGSRKSAGLTDQAPSYSVFCQNRTV